MAPSCLLLAVESTPTQLLGRRRPRTRCERAALAAQLPSGRPPGIEPGSRSRWCCTSATAPGIWKGRYTARGGRVPRCARPAALHLRRTHGVTVSSARSVGCGVVGMWAVGWMGAHEESKRRGRRRTCAQLTWRGAKRYHRCRSTSSYLCDGREGRVSSTPGGEARRAVRS